MRGQDLSGGDREHVIPSTRRGFDEGQSPERTAADVRVFPDTEA